MRSILSMEVPYVQVQLKVLLSLGGKGKAKEAYLIGTPSDKITQFSFAILMIAFKLSGEEFGSEITSYCVSYMIEQTDFYTQSSLTEGSRSWLLIITFKVCQNTMMFGMLRYFVNISSDEFWYATIVSFKDAINILTGLKSLKQL